MQSAMVRLMCDAQVEGRALDHLNIWKTPARSSVDAASCWSQKSSPACGVCQILAKSCHSNSTSPVPPRRRLPGSDQLGPGRDHPDHEPPAPIVSDEIDRVTQALELYRSHRRTGPSSPRARRAGAVEPGERQCHGVGAVERSQETVPNSRGLGHSMDEDGGHGSHTVTAEERSHEAVERLASRVSSSTWTTVSRLPARRSGRRADRRQRLDRVHAGRRVRPPSSESGGRPGRGDTPGRLGQAERPGIGGAGLRREAAAVRRYRRPGPAAPLPGRCRRSR